MHEKDFLVAYWGHMHKIKKDLDKLRKKAHENNFILKRDQQVKKLQVQADWFRQEAMSLNEENKKLRERVPQF